MSTTRRSTADQATFQTSAPNTLLTLYRRTRQRTLSLVEPLSEEDCCVQSQLSCSPAKWHLGHTTWFFERFIAVDALGKSAYNDRFEFLFNSYYNALGDRQPRACRGLLTRPGLGEVLAYRHVVDDAVCEALEQDRLPQQALAALRLGLNHEQQHQELLLMDIKHLFSCSPLHVPYIDDEPAEEVSSASSAHWVEFAGGLTEVGAIAGDGFTFDNESPRHRVFREPFALQNRLITNGEYRAFVEDNGYERAELWLDAGWRARSQAEWRMPAYWCEVDGVLCEFTLYGTRPLRDAEPVLHLSYFEADAFARWSGARLPTEFELETAYPTSAGDDDANGRLLEAGRFHAAPAVERSDRSVMRQVRGDAWEWTSSSYGPYPGYRPPPGAVGEYNGKFMCNQYVLRGGSFATPTDHLRSTYRNFFEPGDRWQFSGLRLARSLNA
ncbi:MAG: ergothioneine biosynthesis protein EgtB [Planctomycetota bacterium]